MTTNQRIVTWIIFGAMLLITLWTNNGFPTPAHSATKITGTELLTKHSYTRPNRGPRICLIPEGCPPPKLRSAHR